MIVKLRSDKHGNNTHFKTPFFVMVMKGEAPTEMGKRLPFIKGMNGRIWAPTVMIGLEKIVTNVIFKHIGATC